MMADALAAIDARVARAESHVEQLLEALPSIPRDQDRVRRRREAFALAAYTKVSEGGYALMNVSDVARLAGVDKRTMYDYIGDKQDLLYLVFLHFLPKQLSAMADGARGHTTPEAALRGMASAHLDYLDEMSGLAFVYYRELRHLNRDQVAEVLALIRDVIGAYEDVVRWGIADGSFRSENPHVSARVAAAAVDMKAVARWDLQDVDDDEIKTTVTTMILRGLGAQT